MADAANAPSRGFTRWQASGLHLLISATIAAFALVLLLKVWYPSPLFTAEGGSDLLFILVAVDVIIGPLITLIIFKSGKPGLRFDLTVIALLQASALVYGVHVMYVARPVYIALVDNQFETVRANDLDPANIQRASRPEFQSVPLTGPVFVAVDLPKDMKVLRDLISRATQGGDVVQHLPEYYVPYSEHAARKKSIGRPVSVLTEGDKAMADRVERLLADSGRKASELNFLPIQTRRGLGAVLTDAKTGSIVKIMPPPDL